MSNYKSVTLAGHRIRYIEDHNGVILEVPCLAGSDVTRHTQTIPLVIHDGHVRANYGDEPLQVLDGGKLRGWGKLDCDATKIITNGCWEINVPADLWAAIESRWSFAANDTRAVCKAAL